MECIRKSERRETRNIYSFRGFFHGRSPRNVPNKCPSSDTTICSGAKIKPALLINSAMVPIEQPMVRTSVHSSPSLVGPRSIMKKNQNSPFHFSFQAASKSPCSALVVGWSETVSRAHICFYVHLEISNYTNTQYVT